jgi:hypothetical protein
MATRAAPLLTSVLFLATACGGSDFTEFAEGASRVSAASRQHVENTARANSASVVVNDAPQIGEQAAQRDTDDAVESGQATSDDAAATQATAQPEPDPSDAGAALAPEPESSASVDAGSDEPKLGIRLIDGQIAAVLSAANHAISAQATAVLPKLEDATLQQLAGDSAAQQSAAEARQEAIVARKRLTPKETETSTQLAQYAAALLAKLNASDACAADSTYLTATIALHEEVLALFDDVLLPSVCDGELKAELAAARAELASVLGRAVEQNRAEL